MLEEEKKIIIIIPAIAWQVDDIIIIIIILAIAWQVDDIIIIIIILVISCQGLNRLLRLHRPGLVRHDAEASRQAGDWCRYKAVVVTNSYFTNSYSHETNSYYHDIDDDDNCKKKRQVGDLNADVANSYFYGADAEDS